MIDKIEESFDKDNNENNKIDNERFALIETIDNGLRETYQYFRDSIYSIFEEIPRNLTNKKIIINPSKLSGDCYKIILYGDGIEISLINRKKSLIRKIKSEKEIRSYEIREDGDSLITKNNQLTEKLEESSPFGKYCTMKVLRDATRFVSKNKKKYTISEELIEVN